MSKMIKKGVLALALSIVPVALFASSAFASTISSAWAASRGAQPSTVLTTAAEQMASESASTGSCTLPSSLPFSTIDYACTVAVNEGAAVSATDSVTPLGTPYGTGYLYGVGVVDTSDGMVAVAVVFAKGPTGVSATPTTTVSSASPPAPKVSTQSVTPPPVVTTTTVPATTTSTTIPVPTTPTTSTNVSSGIENRANTDSNVNTTNAPVSQLAASHAPNVGISESSVLLIIAGLLTLTIVADYTIQRRKYAKDQN
jgi:hypothetical protein